MIMRIIILPIRILLEIPNHLLIVVPLNMYVMLCHFFSKTQMPSAICTAVLRPCIKTNSESLTTTLLLAAISTADFSVQRSVSSDVFHFRSFQDSHRWWRVKNRISQFHVPFSFSKMTRPPKNQHIPLPRHSWRWNFLFFWTLLVFEGYLFVFHVQHALRKTPRRIMASKVLETSRSTARSPSRSLSKLFCRIGAAVLNVRKERMMFKKYIERTYKSKVENM